MQGFLQGIKEKESVKNSPVHIITTCKRVFKRLTIFKLNLSTQEELIYRFRQTQKQISWAGLFKACSKPDI